MGSCGYFWDHIHGRGILFFFPPGFNPNEAGWTLPMRRSPKYCLKIVHFFLLPKFPTFLLSSFGISCSNTSTPFPKFLLQTRRIKAQGESVEFIPRSGFQLSSADPCGIWEFPSQEPNPGWQNQSLEHNGITGTTPSQSPRNAEIW